jgi:hypothetical protein
VIPEGFAGVIPDSLMREQRLSKGVLGANAAGIPVIGIRRITKVPENSSTSEGRRW